MKKFAILLAALLFVSWLVGCVPEQPEPTTTAAPTTQATIPTTQATAPTVPPTTAPPPYIGSALGPIDWELTVSRFNLEGKRYSDSFTMQIAGDILGETEKQARLDIEISFAEHLPYISNGIDGGYIPSDLFVNDYGYYVMSCLVYNTKDNDIVSLRFAINARKGFAIFYFEDKPEFIYVASVSPAADHGLVFEHFRGFINTLRN